MCAHLSWFINVQEWIYRLCVRCCNYACAEVTKYILRYTKHVCLMLRQADHPAVLYMTIKAMDVWYVFCMFHYLYNVVNIWGSNDNYIRCGCNRIGHYMVHGRNIECLYNYQLVSKCVFFLCSCNKETSHDIFKRICDETMKIW